MVDSVSQRASHLSVQECFSPMSFHLLFQKTKNFSFFRVITEKHRGIRERDIHRKEMRLTALILRFFSPLFKVAINTLRPKTNLFSRTAFTAVPLFVFRFRCLSLTICVR